MKLHETFPLMYCLNLAKRQDRRVRCEEVFEEHGLAVRRFPAVNAAFVRRTRGFESAGRYAHAVSTRMILRKARQMRAPAVFIFEDDHSDLVNGVFSNYRSSFGTVLAAKGYPMEERVVGRNLTWTRWVGAPARHPETLATVTPEFAAELLASGCFFARKFGAGSGAGAIWVR